MLSRRIVHRITATRMTARTAEDPIVPNPSPSLRSMKSDIVVLAVLVERMTANTKMGDRRGSAFERQA
jgi:hypothetical protein